MSEWLILLGAVILMSVFVAKGYAAGCAKGIELNTDIYLNEIEKTFDEAYLIGYKRAVEVAEKHGTIMARRVLSEIERELKGEINKN